MSLCWRAASRSDSTTPTPRAYSGEKGLSHGGGVEIGDGELPLLFTNI